MSFYERRLPHIHEEASPLFVTWTLAGALPRGRKFPAATASDAGMAFVAMDRVLHSSRVGPTYLKRPELAQMVCEAIEHHAGVMKHYDLHSYVVMSNHVHMLITPQVAAVKLMKSLKWFTAREGSKMLGVVGEPFWQEESYDRLVRDNAEFERMASYIEMNPVKAGLVSTPEDFLWGSAKRTDSPLRAVSPPY